MTDRERVSFMTKEQLEHYLQDLRSSRPARPFGSRPPPPSIYQQKKLAIEAEVARQRAQTIGEPGSSASPVALPPSQQQENTPGATQDDPALNRRDSQLRRRDSHRRSRTISTATFHSVPSEFSSRKAQGESDVAEMQDHFRGLSLTPIQGNANNALSSSTNNGYAVRDNFSGYMQGHGHNRSHSGVNYDNRSNLGSKESVTSSPTRSRPMMPPYHPPPPNAAKKLEKELQEHFQSNPPPVPHPAPSIVNRPYSSRHGGMVTTPNGVVSTKTPNPSRWVYNESNKSPSNHKANYTANPIPLPSPPPEQNSDGEQRDIGSRESRGRPPLPTMKVKKQPQEKDIAIAEILPHRDVTTPSSAPSIPTMSVSAPSVPVIYTPDDDESFQGKNNLSEISANVPKINTPSINLPGDGNPSAFPPQSRRPLPVPTSRSIPGARALSSLSSAVPGRIGATCVCCHGSISGRIVTALGHRFHPSCFRCFHCHTQLEHVDFFPEPESSCSKRADEFGCRIDQLDKRFYCHLDYHELFSARCKHCKTPIEGEVVVALGETWHVGHFFCAECGDPFTESINFVEKDKYAWCIGCYTKRYSSKCKKCRKPITDTVVKALGGEWHVECFCCDTVKKAFCCFTGDTGGGQEFEGESLSTRTRAPIEERGKKGQAASNEKHLVLETTKQDKEPENQDDDAGRPSIDSGFAEKTTTAGSYNVQLVPEKRRLFSRNGNRCGSGLGYEKSLPQPRPTSATPKKQLLKIQKSRARPGIVTLVPPAAHCCPTSPMFAKAPSRKLSFGPASPPASTSRSPSRRTSMGATVKPPLQK